MKKYQCSICGHIYDPVEGDLTQNIDPGTSFEDIPKSWVCPICGAEKSLFRELLE
jgi:rubredoxin